MSNGIFGYPQTSFEIEVYKDFGGDNWALARYLVKGLDWCWCDTIDEVLEAVKQTLLENDQR